MDWRKARNDLALSFSSQLVYKLLGFAILALLARNLTRAEFGVFSFAGASAGVLVLFTDLGTSSYLVREVAGAPRDAPERFAEVLLVRGVLLGFYLAAAGGFFLFIKPDLLAAGLLSAAYIGLRELYASYASLFVALKRVSYTVGVYGGGLVLLLLCISGTAAFGGGLLEFLACHVLWSASLVVAAALLARRAIGRHLPASSPAAARRALRRSLPFFAVLVLGSIHFSAGTIILGFLKPYAAVATYDAGAKLLEASHFLVRPLGLILFPICAELAAGAKWQELHGVSRKMLISVLTLGAALAAVLAAGAGLIIPFVFGGGYGDSVPVLRVLALAVPGLYASVVGVFLAPSLRLEWRAAGILAGGVASNIALNLLWIPSHGALGAAWAAAVSQSLTAIGLALPLDRVLLDRARGGWSPSQAPADAAVGRGLEGGPG